MVALKLFESSAAEEMEARINLHCLPPLCATLAPCHLLWSGVTAHEWRVNPGRVCSPAPCSGSTLELTQCFWELPGAAKRDGWAAGNWLVLCLRVIDELTQCLLLHGSNRHIGTTGPPYCPKEALCSKKWGADVLYTEQMLESWLCGREDFITESSASPGGVSQQLNNQDRGGLNISREPTPCVALCVFKCFSHCSQSQGLWS